MSGIENAACFYQSGSTVLYSSDIVDVMPCLYTGLSVCKVGKGIWAHDQDIILYQHRLRCHMSRVRDIRSV